MIRKATKIKVNVFSSNQFEVSVVPIKELDQTKAKTAMNVNSQIFFLNGTLSFDIAIVKPIEASIGNRELNIAKKIPVS